MLTANEVGGLMLMMLALPTDNAGDIHATSTVISRAVRHGVTSPAPFDADHAGRCILGALVRRSLR